MWHQLRIVLQLMLLVTKMRISGSAVISWVLDNWALTSARGGFALLRYAQSLGCNQLAIQRVTEFYGQIKATGA
jgi:hypothetical protein